MADTASHTARQRAPRRRAPPPVAALSQTLSLQSPVAQRIYNRAFDRLKADLYTLTVSARTVDMDAAADVAEKFLKDAMDQLKRDLQEDIRRTDVLMDQNDIETTGNYPGAIELQASFTTPQAKRFLDLIQGVDTLAVRLDALWLNQIIDTRNCKDRQYQWQRRLFKTANRTREHAHSARRALTAAQERRGSRPGPGSEPDEDTGNGVDDATTASAEAGAPAGGNGASPTEQQPDAPPAARARKKPAENGSEAGAAA